MFLKKHFVPRSSDTNPALQWLTLTWANKSWPIYSDWKTLQWKTLKTLDIITMADTIRGPTRANTYTQAGKLDLLEDGCPWLQLLHFISGSSNVPMSQWHKLWMLLLNFRPRQKKCSRGLYLEAGLEAVWCFKFMSFPIFALNYVYEPECILDGKWWN